MPPSATSATPVPPLAPQPYRVLATEPETADSWTFHLEPVAGGEPPRFSPGQFNMLYAFGVGEVAISISGEPDRRDRVVHTVRNVGRVSAALAAVRPGHVVGVRGPYGSGWPVASAEGGDVVVMAGGVGLAPLRPVVYDLFARRSRFQRVEIIYGSRTPKDLLYYRELQEWRHRTGTRFQVTVDSAGRDWYGDVGVVTERLPDARFDPAHTTAFVCGPEIMMKLSAQALAARGVPESSIYLSMERNMKCAIAQCGHCQFGPDFVCREGPVFSYAHLKPLLATREL